ncbi:MAG TPA: HAD-IA family hydrolase [Dehalococcoidia bacterium]|nr:HAD-IA family hydrolase [Dehalococcoidia bacterium]
MRVVEALGLTEAFDAIIGLDQVTRGKPDPDIYLRAATALGISPSHCLVIEDSPPGVAAGLAAGMNVIGVANPFTLLGLHDTQLNHDWIVHDPDQLAATVARRIREHNAFEPDQQSE